jgi:hypothetical protein
MREASTGVTRRNGIFGIYGPVLLAAVLIMGAAPSCIMPGCEASGAAASAGACAPVVGAPTARPAESKFISVCDSGADSAPVPQPCHDGGCDTFMTHGIPDAATASAVHVPTVAVLTQLIALPAVMAEARVAEVSVAPEPPPPDPLGVRLSI